MITVSRWVVYRDLEITGFQRRIGGTVFYIDFQTFLQEPNVPLLILKKAIENNRYGGYSLYKNKWSFTGENCGAISMGAFFISREELERRFTISTMQNFSTINLEMFSKRNV